jgi:hypothetical protein
MLADDIAASVGGVTDGLYQGAFGALSKHIARAQRFDLAPEVMRSALTISDSAIGPQLRALPLCRLPFRQCWFEWPGTFSGREAKKRELAAPVPKRMGALVITDDSLQRGSISYAWNHPSDGEDGGINLCPLMVTFDWRADAEPVPDMTDAATWHKRANDDDWTDLAKTFPRVRQSSRADLIAENQRFGVVFNPMLRKFIEIVTESPSFGKLMQAAMLDIEGEPPLLRAAIMLMNSRNLAVNQPRPIAAKLNKARAKRGAAPLQDYTHVAIRLTRALAARAGHASDRYQPHRLHLVRGHFKLKYGKIFWWSPHTRGVPDPHNPINRQDRSVSL